MHLYNIEIDYKNTTFIDNIKFYSPLFTKNIISKKYKLNDLQRISFENFIESTTTN
jgi:hypothetical protein